MASLNSTQTITNHRNTSPSKCQANIELASLIKKAMLLVFSASSLLFHNVGFRKKKFSLKKCAHFVFDLETWISGFGGKLSKKILVHFAFNQSISQNDSGYPKLVIEWIPKSRIRISGQIAKGRIRIWLDSLRVGFRYLKSRITARI